MRKVIVLMLILVFLTALCYITPLLANASPKMIVVPDDFPTIKIAINSATDGDSIYVRNGVYSENLVIDKPLSIIGEDPARTIINGTESIVTINAPNVVISGFTIGTPRMLQESSKWGIKYHSAMGLYGVYVNSTSNCNITNNRIVNTRYGIYLSTSASNNNLINNLIIHVEIGINLLASVHSVVSGNQIVFSTRAIILQRSSYTQILENTLINQTDGIVLYGWQEGNYGHSTYNLIRANNISNSEDYGIRLVDSLNNRVLENRIWSTPSRGIALEWGASFNFVISNLIYNFVPNSGYWGMEVYDSNDNLISANYIVNPLVVNNDSRFTGGIVAMNISNTQIIGNKIENNQEGINFNALSSANNTLYANQIKNTTYPYIIGNETGFQYYQYYPPTNSDNMSIPQTDYLPQLSTMPNIEIPEVEIPVETTTAPPSSPMDTMVVLAAISVIAVFLVLIVAYFALYRRHRKTTNESTESL